MTQTRRLTYIKVTDNLALCTKSANRTAVFLTFRNQVCLQQAVIEGLFRIRFKFYVGFRKSWLDLCVVSVHSELRDYDENMASIELTTEENELLSENGRPAPLTERRAYSSFQMEEPTFSRSRSGSEEDMLEYDDPVTCDACKRRRQCTAPEKILLVFGAICVIIIIAMSVTIGNKKEEKLPVYCDKKGCLQAASSILSAMDPAADPCMDFHQYACGGWLRDTPIPPGYGTWDRFQELSYKNMYGLNGFIESNQLVGTAEAKVRTFYQSCMNESAVTRSETLGDFRDLLVNLTDAHESFSVQAMLREVHKLNAWPFFQLTVGPDERTNDQNIIKIELGQSPFPLNVFQPEIPAVVKGADNRTKTTTTPAPDSVATTPTPSGVVVNSSLTNTTDTADSGYNVVDNGKDAERVKHSHPKPNVTELTAKYLKETSATIQIIWQQTTEAADTQAEQIFQLEKRLAEAQAVGIHLHNRTQAYNFMKIPQLQSKCPLIDWTQHLSAILGTASRPIASSQGVIILHEGALLHVCKIVQEYNRNETRQAILRRYMELSVVRSLKPYFDLSTFQTDMTPEIEFELEGEHWRRCTFYANKALGFATGAIYVNGSALQGTLDNVKTMVNYVKRGFKQYLLRKIWLDKNTKHNAEAKLDAMIEKVSYPDYILNTTFLDDYYKQFSVGSDWFRNLINWRAFDIKRMSRLMGEAVDRTNSWINPPVTVESDYSAVRNDISFPSAMLHLPIFSPDGPSAMNFGAIGSIIGHEITHAFDIQGRQYDGFGRLRDWWDPITTEMFNKTTYCMKDQYDEFKIGDLHVNGERTLEENIADNGGIRAAHVAYELWLNEHGDEKPLPGVTLNNRQIFYVSFAQLFCSKWKPDGIKDFLMRDTHSPGPFRIQGALSNSLAFKDVFQCSRFATYNPPLKCQVW